MLDKGIKNLKRKFVLTVSILFTAPHALAATYNIGTGGSGSFDLMTKALQAWIDFMTGPYSKAALAGTAIFAVIAWALAPKEGVMAIFVRILIAGVVALNVSTFMGLLGG